MAIQNWSDDILVVELSDDPQFTDDVDSLLERLETDPEHVVLNFESVGFINSSNLSRLLRLRKLVLSQSHKLILCAASTQVWGVFMVTGLDKIFEFTNDMVTALATLQLNEPAPGKAKKSNTKK